MGRGTTLIVSQRSTSSLFPDTSPLKRFLPPIEAFLVENRAVRFQNGHVESQVDIVLFCTGYLYSFPFLSSLNPAIVGDGSRLQNTYQHLFYAPHPTLAFIALPMKVVPFPVSEAQACVLARIFSGRLSLPSLATMQAWELEEVNRKGVTRQFHVLPFPQDVEYINFLWTWAMKAQGLFGEPAIRTKGKMAKKWTEWDSWVRMSSPRIRRAFTEHGERRSRVTKLEDLGFVF